MKPFDLEAAKNGAPVHTIGGHFAKIITFDAKTEVLGTRYPIIALVDLTDGQTVVCFDFNGVSSRSEKHFLILCMKTVKKTGYVISLKIEGRLIFWGEVYPTREQAAAQIRAFDKRVCAFYFTTQISYED